jgi:predicted Zn-dependent protease
LASILALARPPDAKDAARHALKLDPGNEKALVALCDAIHGANTAELFDDAEQTRHYIEQLQKQDKDRASYHLALGTIDYHEKKLAAAETELNKARGLDPKSSLVQVALAQLCLAHTNTAGAEEAFKAAVALAPLRSPVRLLYANFQVLKGATNEARESMLDLNRKAPDYMPPLLFLMNLSFKQHQLDQCDADLAKVLAREPDNNDALFLKGRVSLEKGEAAQAVTEFERLSFLSAKHLSPDVPYYLGAAYLLSGNTAKAMSSLSHCLELDTKSVPAKMMLAD